MTAEHFAGTELFESVDVPRLLEELSRIYRWLLVTDARHRVVWMSQGLRGLPGIENLEIGSDARAFIENLPRPEQVLSLRRDLRKRRFLTGAPLDLRLEDGQVVPVEVSLLDVQTTEPGAPLMVAIARPVDGSTAREDDETDEVFEAVPDAILVVDAGGFVSRANSAALRLTGRSRPDLVGHPAVMLFSGSVSDLERAAKSLRGDAPREYRTSLVRADGKRVAVSVTACLGSTERAGAILCIRCAGERERVEAELRRANDELEHCITSLAHDLRSPLVALLGFSRLLRQEYGEAIGETGRHFVDRIEEAGRTIEGLVHHVLELSRAGQPGERTAWVDPREVLSQLRAELKPRLEEANIELVLPEPAPPLLSCDRTRLYQVFSNLIGNAIQHMGTPLRPRIEVSVEEESDAHLIFVRDNGRGIDPAHIGRIFEPFQSFATSPRSRGAGMGLAIVKKIVEKRGGRISVESELGKGTCFQIRLPRR
ncbi:MAG TPA: PAS domain-containing sensor histidine kinase [Myxococcota bacterium]|nr:PAS domain-containing sensor histidine kinase [Myxococcota bacterium]